MGVVIGREAATTVHAGGEPAAEGHSTKCFRRLARPYWRPPRRRPRDLAAFLALASLALAKASDSALAIAASSAPLLLQRMRWA